MKSSSDLPIDSFIKYSIGKNPEAIFWANYEGNLVFVTTAACDSLGYTESELLSKTVFDITPSLTKTKWKNFLKNSDKRNPVTIVEGHNRKDGSTFPVEIVDYSIDIDGKEFHSASVNDIPGKSEPQNQIIENEEKFRNLFYKNSSICLLLNPKTAEIIDANEAALKYYGYDYSEITSMDISQINVLPKEEIMLAIEKVLNSEKKSFRFQHKLKSGEVKHVEVYPTIIDTKSDKYLLSFIYDISKRVKTEELNKMLKHSLDIFTDGIYWFDSENKFVYINEAGGAAFGCKPEDLLGKHLSYVNPTTTTESLADLWHKLRTEGIYTAETVHKRLDGSEFYVEIRTVYVNYEGKEYYNGFARDITERKLAEKELIIAKEKAEESENKYREFFDEDLAADYITSANGDIVECNKAFLDMFGFTSKSEAKKINVVNLHPSENHRAEFISRLIREKHLINYEMELKKITGEVIYTNQNARGKFDKAGNLKYIQGYLIDVTESKKAEKTLKEREAMLQSIFRAAPVGIGVVSNRILIWTNDMLHKITGYSSEEMLHKSARMLYPTEKEFLWVGEEKYRQISAHGTGTVETKWLRKDGKVIDVLLSSTPINPENLVEGVTFSALDITERKKMERDLIAAKEEAEKADNLKSEFLAQISHEIRTPVNTILSFSQLIRDEFEGLVNEDLKKSFQGVSNAGQRLIRTIDLLLNMSEVQSGSYDYNPRKINLYDEILQGLHLEYFQRAKEKGLSFKFIEPETDFSASVDEYTARQIFANLIDNAIKYTEKGEIVIECKNSKTNLTVSVKDSGIGISKKYMPYIYEPFLQEEQGYTRRFEGNGLGLALVKKYCELNNAELDVKSKKGVGSTFSVIFKR